ncbi:MAG: Maf family protein [Firmicutes bacterium]|nr:Maf family protein [Bacillota bacterium]
MEGAKADGAALAALLFGTKPVILASASPRRRQLLQQIGVEPALRRPVIEETAFAPGGDPRQVVMENACRKARAVCRPGEPGWIIGGDTLVFQDGHAYGKPADAAEARRMLQRLSGNAHTVYSGLCLLDQESGVLRQGVSQATVEFLPLPPAWIDAYVAGGEPLDKAGGYGIQGQGALLVKQIRGNYGAVVGMDVCLLARLLQES